MKYLLDTNTCIRYMNGRAPKLRAKFLTIQRADIVLCSVVKAEMLYGASPARSLAKQLRFFKEFVSLPFDDRAAVIYGRIRARLKIRGTPIGANDLLIAAIAIANDLILVTHNIKEFSRIDDLAIEDWEA